MTEYRGATLSAIRRATAVGKANISFPEGMLEAVDAQAAVDGTTRSAFVQEATAAYLAQRDYETARDERALRVAGAKTRMRRVGASLPPGPDGATLIRQMRDSVPAWLESQKHRDNG